MDRVEKKTIRLALACSWGIDHFKRSHTFDLLSKHFLVIFDQQNPDFLIASCAGNLGDALRFDCPRIQIVGEPITTDLTLFDYAVGFDYLIAPDSKGFNRYFRLPYAYWKDESQHLGDFDAQITTSEAKQLLHAKTGFCNFLSSHESFCGDRERLLSFVNKYKRVDSAGTFMNNMADGFQIGILDRPQKIAFQERYKFSIACESFAYPGFVTEKIFDALAAHTVPIYFGDPLICKTINKDCFINVSDFDDEQSLLEHIRKVDTDDDLYCEMLSAKKLKPEMSFATILSEYEAFLVRIFSQNRGEAYRRQRYSAAVCNFEQTIIDGGLTFVDRVKRRFRRLSKK